MLLCVLDHTGDTELRWDHEDPEEVATAREQVMALKAKGYSFFTADGTVADEVEAGAGQLVFKRISAEQVLEHKPALRLDDAETTATPPVETPPRRGRGRPAKPEPQPDVIAVRAQQGG